MGRVNVHLVGLCLQVFEVIFGSRYTLVVGHIPLHHLIIGVFQQEGVGSRNCFGHIVRLGEIFFFIKKKQLFVW